MGFLLSLLITLGTASAGQPAEAEWVWPLAPRPVVLRAFQPPPQPWLAGHRGVDLAGRAGQEVRAAGQGVVTFAGPVAGRPVVVVSHGALRTTYEPVAANVSVGERVRAGAVIGALRASGPHCGPARICLHWGLLRGAIYLDPLALLKRGPIRLLPADGSLRAPGGAPPALSLSAGRAPGQGLEEVPAPVQAAARPAAPRANEPLGTDVSPHAAHSLSLSRLATAGAGGALTLALTTRAIIRRRR
jgi:murein DD-endopeptidase MepM/ murein hydrolase activator NlpD